MANMHGDILLHQQKAIIAFSLIILMLRLVFSVQLLMVIVTWEESLIQLK